MRNSYILYFVIVFSLILTSCKKDLDVDVVHFEEGIQSKSFKRGVSYNFQVLEDFDVLADGITWYYNWGNTPGKAQEEKYYSFGLDYYPMAWNGSYNKSNIAEFKQNHPECEYILAYNEPNLTDQANMIPSQAAKIWPELKSMADELGLKIIAPAMNYGTLANYGDPIKWLDEFFDLVPISDVHGIAIHCYMANGTAFKEYVKMFKKYNLPIWMTEFCAWEESIGSAVDQMNYMCDVLNYMEQDPDVYRYAWFIPRFDGSVNSYPYMQLLSKKINKSTNLYDLTDLGKVYINFSTFDQNTSYVQGQKITAAHYQANNTIEVINQSGLGNTVRVRPTTDREGILEVSGLIKGTWVSYIINVSKTQNYQLSFRYSAYRDTEYEIYLDDKLITTVTLAKTGSIEENIWETFSTNVKFNAGRHNLKIQPTKGNASLNWLSFE